MSDENATEALVVGVPQAGAAVLLVVTERLAQEMLSP